MATDDGWALGSYLLPEIIDRRDLERPGLPLGGTADVGWQSMGREPSEVNAEAGDRGSSRLRGRPQPLVPTSRLPS